MKILIDAGHGGSAPGAVYNGVEEEDLNLLIALHCQKVLAELGHTVFMTRSEDQDVSLLDRLDKIIEVGTEVFVSIHCNASSENPKVEGCETFYRDEEDKQLAEAVQTMLSTYTGRKDRGVLNDIDFLKKKLTVLNNLPVPSCLVEVGYLSNEKDRDYIKNNTRVIGEVVAHGIDLYVHKKIGKPKSTWPA